MKTQTLKKPKNPQAEVDRWNQEHRSGIRVQVLLDNGAKFQTTTRSDAFVLSGHSAVIMVEGISGCYRLDRVKPL